MSTLLQWTDREGATVALEIDVTPTEGYEHAAEVTEHPVETGSDIADHVKPGNDMISLEGVVSNTPVRIPSTQTRGLTRAARNVDLTVAGQPVRVQLQQWSGTLDRVRECDAVLAALVRDGTIVSLTTGLRTTPNLVLVRYRVDRSAENGTALPLTLDFKRVRVVSTSRVAVPAIPAARVAQNRGAVPPVEQNTTLYNAVHTQFPRLFGGGS